MNITVLFQAIFDLFDKIKYFNFRKEIQNFFQTNGDMIIQLILKNLSVFNLDSYFKIHKLDLKYSDQDLIFAKFKSIQNYCILIYFLQYSCINVSTEKLKKISPNLNQFLNFKIKENDWNEVMLITNFFKNHELNDLIQPLQFQTNIPSKVKESLFGYYLSKNDNIETSISCILDDPIPEQNDRSFEILFRNLVKNKKLLQVYLAYIFTKHNEENICEINSFLKAFKNEFDKYKDDAIDVANQMFFYKVEENILICKCQYKIEKNIPDFANDLITQLFTEIKDKKSNYQAFYCLMNLANSFPVIFSQFTKKMFTIIYKSADYLSLIFEKKEDDENLPFIKTGYTALLFLLGALKSTLVIDDYFQWLFGRIETFTDIQVLCTFMILNTINDDIRIHYLSQIYVSKYSFFNTISKLLKRNVCEGYFMTCYKDNIYKYITDTYSLCLNYNMYIAAQIDELKKKEKPLNFAYNEIYYDTPRF